MAISEFLTAGKNVSYLWTILFLLCSSVSVAAGVLELSIVDKESGKSTPARVRIIGNDGQFYFAEKPLKGEENFPVYFKSNKWGEEKLFYTPGRSKVPVPAGKTEILVEKGFEYTPVELTVDVPAEGKAAVEVVISRWINMKKLGWYSGDPHVHFRRTRKEDSANFLEILKAEDVNVVGSHVISTETALDILQYAYGKEGIQEEGDYHIYSGEEFRNGYSGEGYYGHFLIFNPDKLIEPVGTGKLCGMGNPEDYPPCYVIFQKAHKSGAIVIAAHSGRGEMPVGLILGEIDGIEVFQSGRWDRRLKPYAEGKPHWYHALNCGFKVSGTSGSDYAYLTSKVPFHERMYVQIDGEYGVDRWMKALKQGRSFLTTGPLLLDFDVDGHHMGDTIRLKKPGKTVEYSVDIRSTAPVENVELIRNGEVVRTVKNPDNLQNINISGTLQITASAWIAVRAKGLHPVNPRKNLMVHSNPIYIEVDEKPVLVKDSAGFFVKWLDDSITWIENEACFLTPGHKNEVLHLFGEARRYYEELSKGSKITVLQNLKITQP